MRSEESLSVHLQEGLPGALAHEGGHLSLSRYQLTAELSGLLRAGPAPLSHLLQLQTHHPAGPHRLFHQEVETFLTGGNAFFQRGARGCVDRWKGTARGGVVASEHHLATNQYFGMLIKRALLPMLVRLNL